MAYHVGYYKLKSNKLHANMLSYDSFGVSGALEIRELELAKQRAAAASAD